MTFPLKPDSYVINAGGDPGSNDWYDYVHAFYQHIIDNSTKWSVDNHTDNGTDIGITLSPDASLLNFQVNYRNDPANLELLMSVDPNSEITDPLAPTNSSSAAPEDPLAGTADPASQGFHPHILVVEFLDAIGFMTVGGDNTHVAEWHFGGDIYETYFASEPQNQPNRGFPGLAWYGGIPRALNGGWGRDSEGGGNAANKARLGGQWVSFQSGNMDANDTYSQFTEQQVPSAFDLEVNNDGGSRFGFAKYAFEIPDLEASEGWKIIDMPQQTGLLVINHTPSDGGRTLTVPWDVSVNPALKTHDVLNWVLQSSFTSTDMRDTYFLSSTEGWTVGLNGSVWSYDGTGWTKQNVPTSENIFAVDAVDSSNVWVGGSGGVILHWDGSSWTAETTPNTNNVNALDMVSTSDGWAHGLDHFWRYDGSTWSEHTSATDINAIQLLTSSEGWAVGNTGTVYQWDGSSWTQLSVDSNIVTMNDISVVDSNNAWAAGNDGQIIYWDGSSWTIQSTPVSGFDHRLQGIHMVDATTGWAVGFTGTVLIWDGTSWTEERSPVKSDLFGTHFIDATDGWAVGAGGDVIRRNV